MEKMKKDKLKKTSGGYWATPDFESNYDALAFSEEEVAALKWIGFKVVSPIHPCTEYDNSKYSGYKQYDVYDKNGIRLNYKEVQLYLTATTMFAYDNSEDKLKKY